MWGAVCVEGACVGGARVEAARVGGARVGGARVEGAVWREPCGGGRAGGARVEGAAPLTSLCRRHTGIFSFFEAVRTHADVAPWSIVAVFVFPHTGFFC